MPRPDDVTAAEIAHRRWWEIGCAGGGRQERFPGCDLYAWTATGTFAFPEPGADFEAAIGRCRELGLREVGCWSRTEDAELGRRLNAVGFQDGWWPHWMAADPAPAPDDDGVIPLDSTASPLRGMPYWNTRFYALAEQVAPGEFVHLGIRQGEAVAGHVAVLLAGEVAGVFDMAVAPQAQRQGYGLRLARAALGAAANAGCQVVALNATGEGEPVYRRAGFRSAGWGATWWWFPR